MKISRRGFVASAMAGFAVATLLARTKILTPTRVNIPVVVDIKVGDKFTFNFETKNETGAWKFTHLSPFEHGDKA